MNARSGGRCFHQIPRSPGRPGTIRGFCGEQHHHQPDVALISAPMGERFFTENHRERPPCEEVGILIIVSASCKQRTGLIDSVSWTHEGMFWEHRYRCTNPLIRLERSKRRQQTAKQSKHERRSKPKLRYRYVRKQVENLNV